MTIQTRIMRNNFTGKFSIMIGKDCIVNCEIEPNDVVDLTNLLLYGVSVINIVKKLKDVGIKAFYFDLSRVNPTRVEEYKKNYRFNVCARLEKVEDNKIIFSLLS